MRKVGERPAHFPHDEVTEYIFEQSPCSCARLLCARFRIHRLYRTSYLFVRIALTGR